MPTRLLTTVEEARDLSRSWRASGRNVVLVPTMGDLHEGHLSLVRAGLEVGEVVVSIFVNPTQFAPGEDFESYPRRLEVDRARLEEVGAAAIFAPPVEELYPSGETTRVEVRELSAPLCGQHREGHFLGVTTVCTKLFLSCEPGVAIFGQKDAQQCLVLWRLVRDLRLPIDLVFSPTVREKDGLAMSSRNRYLEGEERARAVTLARALGRGRELLASGERDVATIEASMRSLLAEGADRPDYVELRRVPDLARLDVAEGRVLLAAAAYVGRARLIDNLCLEVGETVREVPLLDAHTLQAVRARRAG